MSTAYTANAACATGTGLPHAPSGAVSAWFQLAGARWSWACRVLAPDPGRVIPRTAADGPRAGDLALVEVDQLGSHERITLRENLRLRIYPGDRIVAVFGNRYATDAYEGEVRDIGDLSLLTAGGMIGTVRSRHRSMGRPTSVKFLGYVADASGHVVNLKERAFRHAEPVSAPRNLVAMVGTGMNAGKTTSCVRLIKSLTQQGLRVAACKLTGSVSNRDQDEMRAASAVRVLDFSDYGFPSTYLCSEKELLELFDTLLADLEPAGADVTVMEIADGILQRETAMLLESVTVRSRLSGAVLAADNALSARYALNRLEELGHKVLAITGLLTSSPLCVRELGQICQTTVASSAGDATSLGTAVASALGLFPAVSGQPAA
ncbi:MAG: DUF1611 domain-containing protein [Bryobacterales bacterium]|nr:DUF1611 domain-containing protein [Bryobacterales bacterium]